MATALIESLRGCPRELHLTFTEDRSARWLGLEEAGVVPTDDTVARDGVVSARHAATPTTGWRDEARGVMPLIVPGTKKGWRRAGFGLAPLTLVIDITAVLAASRALTLSGRSSLLLTLLVLALNGGAGQYRARIAPSLLDELPGLVGRALVAGAVATSLRVFVELPVQDGLVYASLVFIVLAVAGRMLAYPLMRVYRRSGGLGDPTIIVGSGNIGCQVADTLIEHPEYGLWPVGYVDDDPLVRDRRIPVMGGLSELPGLLREYRIRNVIVAFTTSRESRMVDALRACDRMSCEIFFVPRLYELHGAGPDTEVVWGLPLTRLSRASYRTLMWRTKRAFDLVVASVALVLLSPLMLACALAVRLEGGPGVIFRQERVGLDGHRFQILKFRSIRLVPGEAPGPWNIGRDPRVGPVGRTMRKLSLDELPQLWNIIRGDMSLVGPRPERPSYVEEFSAQFPRYVARHRVPAGLTGWAQVHGLRGDTDIADRAAFDNYYIENWSMWSDIKITLRTVGQVLCGRGR
jgi:exopolysaccharide biosynthesis polyprenyl glycosylphosphotransferase